ncbi:uncharacterized protein LOC135351625 isoform X2 [Halichondria panicea]|uniref:uncharacterized protein LOC135351625 isoform X2 n=1 Tax=Halichondria panicea TaxID=6063 RepID=UPI00312B8A23
MAISIGTLTLPGQCSKVKNLYFQNNKPSGNTHVACLTMAIKANIFGNLEWLQLSNTLPDNVEENGRLLTELLPSIAFHCPHLNDIDLSENNIGVPGAGAIGEIFVRLATNRKDLELNLSETNLNSEAAKEFSDKVLASLEDVSNPLSCELDLRVDNNPLGHSGLLAIFRMLSNQNCPVTRLDLDHTHTVNQGLLSATHFETLTFPGQCSKLKRLSFQNNKPSGDTHVACLTMAIKANIFGNLERMQLSNTLPDNVEENGRLLTELLPSIASHCPHLNDIDLSENNIGVPGAGAIGEIFVRLATNRKDLELKLLISETNLNSEAAKEFSDKVLASLEDVSNPLSCEINLRVDNNPLGHSGLLAIFRMLSNENCPVTRLDLDDTHAVKQGQITAISIGTLTLPGQCSKVKNLYFQNNKPSGNTHVACLTMAIKANIFGNLEWLQLSNTLPGNVEENGRLLTELLPSIASHCPHLNDIDLSENNIGVPGAGAIGEIFVRLATNRKELELNLSETNLDSEAAKVFSDKVLASLEDVSNPLSCEIDLHVDNNPLGHSGLLAIFRMLSNENCPVTRLDLDHTHAVNQGQIKATYFGQFNKLKKLSFQNNKPSGDTHVACLTIAIKANIFGNLERMQLSNTLPDNVEENGRLLTELLPSIASHCPHLEDLDLSENNIGVPGAGAIGKAFVRLATNRKELELNLSETNLDSEAAKELSDKVLASFEDVSNPLSCKIKLCVDNNPLGHSGLSAIFRMLSSENCPITRLHLESTLHTSITDLCLNNPVLNSESLNSNTISIGLWRNLLHGKNIFILAECIQCCPSLEKLDCDQCQVTSNDVFTLFSYLKSHDIQRKCLKCLDLQNNSIGDDAVTALITYLPSVFPCIEDIDLDDNLVSTEGLKRLEEFLQERNTSEDEEFDYTSSESIPDDASDSLPEYSNTDSEDSTSDDTDFKSTAEDLNELQEDMSPTASQDSTATETSDKLISQKQQLQSLPIERDIEVTNEQLDTTVEETHLSEMLSQSDSTHDGYLESGLSSGQQSDVTINTLREVPTSLTVETLKRESNITDEQLDTRIEEIDLPKLSSYFDNTNDYVEMLRLSPGQQTDVIEEKARTAMNRTQAGIKLALKYWLDRVVAEGTFRALLLILISLDKGDVAIKVAQYLSAKVCW